MSKHTAGPWEITGISMNTGNISVGAPDLRIVIAEVTNAASFGDMLAGAVGREDHTFSSDDCHTQFANARLIAAAPKLLKALKRIAFDWDGEPEDMAEANEAIAEAEGRPATLTRKEDE